MPYKPIRTVLALLLIAALALPFAGCASKKGESARGVCVAYTDAEFSDGFIQSFNPLYAESEREFALGTLIAPTVMRYDEASGWVPVLGTIETAVEDGVTVATITLKSGLTFNNYNSQKLTLDHYRWTLEKILRTNYFGYFMDFYKNPIKGIVEFRYSSKGLTLENVPDFDALVNAELNGLTRDAYRDLLTATGIAGLYTSNENPESISPDGRRFKEIVLEESTDEQVREKDFFTTVTRTKMLSLLADIFAQKDPSEWMIKKLRNIRYSELQNAFLDECRNTYKSCAAIDGYRATGTNSCKITFTKVVDGDEAIRMLNLPILHNLTLDSDQKAIGAGSYKFADVTGQGRAPLIRLTSSKGDLLVTNVDRAYAAGTLYMRQLSAVAFSSAPDEKENEAILRYGLGVFRAGECFVVYNPELIGEKQLNDLSLMFV